MPVLKPRHMRTKLTYNQLFTGRLRPAKLNTTHGPIHRLVKLDETWS